MVSKLGVLPFFMGQLNFETGKNKISLTWPAGKCKKRQKWVPVYYAEMRYSSVKMEK